MKSTLMHLTPATGPSCYVAATQWTGLSFAGTAVAPAAAEVAVAGVRNIDLPGSPPRGAPV